MAYGYSNLRKGGEDKSKRLERDEVRMLGRTGRS